MIWQLAQHHQYSISDLEDLIPFERDIYIQLLLNHLEKLKEEANRK